MADTQPDTASGETPRPPRDAIEDFRAVIAEMVEAAEVLIGSSGRVIVDGPDFDAWCDRLDDIFGDLEPVAAAGGVTPPPDTDAQLAHDPSKPICRPCRTGDHGACKGDFTIYCACPDCAEAGAFATFEKMDGSRVAPLPDTAAPPMDDEAFAWLMAAVKETEASDTAAADEKRGAAWVRANVLAAGGAGVAPQPPDAAPNRHVLVGDLGWLEYAIADYIAKWGEHLTGRPYTGEFGPNTAGMPTAVANMAMTVIRKNLAGRAAAPLPDTAAHEASVVCSSWSVMPSGDGWLATCRGCGLKSMSTTADHAEKAMLDHCAASHDAAAGGSGVAPQPPDAAELLAALPKSAGFEPDAPIAAMVVEELRLGMGTGPGGDTLECAAVLIEHAYGRAAAPLPDTAATPVDEFDEPHKWAGGSVTPGDKP